jgi:hypothetical protein
VQSEGTVLSQFLSNTLISVAHYCYSIFFFILSRILEAGTRKKDICLEKGVQNVNFEKIPLNLLINELPLAHASKIVRMFTRKKNIAKKIKNLGLIARFDGAAYRMLERVYFCKAEIRALTVKQWDFLLGKQRLYFFLSQCVMPNPGFGRSAAEGGPETASYLNKIEMKGIETMLKDLIDYVFSRFKLEHCGRIEEHPAFSLNFIIHTFFEGEYEHLVKILDDKIFQNLSKIYNYVEDS